MQQYNPQFTTVADVSTVVIVVRDPDYSNTYAAWTRPEGDGRLVAFDVDLGANDLDDTETRREFNGGLTHDAIVLREAGFGEAADYLLSNLRDEPDDDDDE